MMASSAQSSTVNNRRRRILYPQMMPARWHCTAKLDNDLLLFRVKADKGTRHTPATTLITPDLIARGTVRGCSAIGLYLKFSHHNMLPNFLVTTSRSKRPRKRRRKSRRREESKDDSCFALCTLLTWWLPYVYP